MIHEWTVTRHDPVEDTIFGVFDMGLGSTSFSLERLAVSIPEGRYRVILTVSGRAEGGSLWAPYPDCRLPLICDVPGREGIRIHAANRASELLGCIAVGAAIVGDSITGSRPSVTRVVNELRALPEGDEIWVTMKNDGGLLTPRWARSA